jgi:hypothetical protein
LQQRLTRQGNEPQRGLGARCWGMPSLVAAGAARFAFSVSFLSLSPRLVVSRSFSLSPLLLTCLCRVGACSRCSRRVRPDQRPDSVIVVRRPTWLMSATSAFVPTLSRGDRLAFACSIRQQHTAGWCEIDVKKDATALPEPRVLSSKCCWKSDYLFFLILMLTD